MDLDYVENYITEKEALKKLKNTTKAKLLTEFDGKVYVKLRYGMYLIHKPSYDGSYYK